jgi:hypothetical protein
MNSEKNTDPNLKPGGLTPLGSDMTALQMLKQVTCSEPRALTEFEIELLIKSKKEVSDRVQHLMAVRG